MMRTYPTMKHRHIRFREKDGMQAKGLDAQTNAAGLCQGLYHFADGAMSVNTIAKISKSR